MKTVANLELVDNLPELPGIYAIVNLENYDRYVGQAKNIRQRVKTHLNKLNKGTHKTNSRELLQKAWNRYGSDSFFIQILELVEDNSGETDYHVKPDNLSLAEHFYINAKSEYNVDKRIVRSEFEKLIEKKEWRISSDGAEPVAGGDATR